jgi:hypothetical protein
MPVEDFDAAEAAREAQAEADSKRQTRDMEDHFEKQKREYELKLEEQRLQFELE